MENGKEKSKSTIVEFHLGAEHVAFETELSATLASLKARGLTELQIVIDPSIDYLLRFEGATVEDENQTLAALLGDHPRPRVQFHIKKRPKGGQ